MVSHENLTRSVSDLENERKIDAVCMDFERSWKSGETPDLQVHAESLPNSAHWPTAFTELLLVEIELRTQRGELLTEDEYTEKHPSYASEIQKAFTIQSRDNNLDIVNEVRDLEQKINGFARFTIKRRLGTGAFGVVYLAWDNHTKQDVALKFALSKGRKSSTELHQLFQESVATSNLNHPNIIKMYELGYEEDTVFLIYQYVDGCNLQEHLNGLLEPMSPFQAAELVAKLAGALNYAHSFSYYHRDLKPSNILLDKELNPYITDFGLAVHENQQSDLSGDRSGTPKYMSPELVRGESHRIDGRSDIWSLGVLFYQILVGRCPFNGADPTEVYDEIANREVRPPRQSNPKIPVELERICLKCLSKRVADRYLTASDLEHDLHGWLKSRDRLSDRTDAKSSLCKITPRGLRSFCDQDSDFYLHLLPGPVNREGVPECLSFWQHRLQGSSSEPPIEVGLIYGPSGSGKSSFVLAGLLPLLDSRFEVAYIQASASRTETQLKHHLRRKLRDLPNCSLAQAVRMVREGHSLPKEKKLLIVIDQLEQWLAANQNTKRSELISALRQCDGHRTQCLLLVRDDFWLSTSRLLHDLEVGISEGQNARAFDLFDVQHARFVLTQFGIAYGKLPENGVALSADQSDFIDTSIRALSNDGKVVCARLVLYTEIFKSRDWNLRSFNQIGGTDGVGLTFLLDSFSGEHAPSRYKMHEKNARAVLRHLLPQSGANIRGGASTVSELFEATEYKNDRPRFDDLLLLLDSELRLITPVQTDSIAGQSTSGSDATEVQYELTHDFLIRPIRCWITEEQIKSRRGRAKLRLAQTTTAWISNPKNQYLPSLLECLSYWYQFRESELTYEESSMLKSARRYIGTRTLGAVVLLLAILFTLRDSIHRIQARSLVNQLSQASSDEATPLLKQIDGDLRYTRPIVVAKYRSLLNQKSDDGLLLGMALLDSDELSDADLLRWIYTGSPAEVELIGKRLASSNRQIQEALWGTIADPNTPAAHQIRSASVLAQTDASDERWRQHSEHLIENLPKIDPLDVGRMSDLLQPVWQTLAIHLVGPIETARHSQRSIVLELAKKQPNHEIIIRLESRYQQLRAQYTSNPDDGPPETLRGLINVTTGLAILGRPNYLWDLLADTENLSLATELIEQISLEIPRETLFAQLHLEENPIVKTRVILGLGGDRKHTPRLSQQHARQIADIFRDDLDASVHSAAEWLLRKAGIPLPGSGESPIPNHENASWRISDQGFTLVRFPSPGKVPIARDGRPQPTRENHDYKEQIRVVEVNYAYWLSSKEITVAEFRKFRPDHLADSVPKLSNNRPVSDLTWYQAAEYCNYLSQQEGLPKDQYCYLPNKEGKFGPGMRLAENFRERLGYRLPLEAEWENAYGAKTRSTWSCGDDSTQLVEYGWFRNNTNHLSKLIEVGQLKPNRFGMFDMHGNVEEWLQDPYTFSDSLLIEPHLRRVKKGGMIDSREDELACASGVGAIPRSTSRRTGLRVLRLATGD